ncbi:putative glucan 1,3-beta-glucosidase [Helianthus debilis subsp. tardiflorus]
MHANRDLITGYHKDKLNFKGFVISDWEGIDRITLPPHSNYTYSVLASSTAGIDIDSILLWSRIITLSSLMTLNISSKNKFIPMDRIDDAVTRSLRVKFTMRLFENPIADFTTQRYSEKQGSEPVLPLPKRASKVLVAGSHADNLGYQCGGWTIGWHGFVRLNILHINI